jgi:hypothetical protein
MFLRNREAPTLPSPFRMGDRNLELLCPRWEVDDRKERSTCETMVSGSEGDEANREARRGVLVSDSNAEAREQALPDLVERKGSRAVGSAPGPARRGSNLSRVLP